MAPLAGTKAPPALGQHPLPKQVLLEQADIATLCFDPELEVGRRGQG